MSTLGRLRLLWPLWPLPVAAIGVCGLATSCASAPQSQAVTEILQPDYASYAAYVDPYFQRRCGTLDCHGQPGRAFRLYSVNGLRPFDVGDAGSGPPPTSGGAIGGPGVLELEQRSNFEAAVALEPEEMTRVMGRQGQEPNTLLLLRKPLELERHKGGKSMLGENDRGYECVVGWLRVRVTRRRDDGDFERIPEGQREALPQTVIEACQKAASYR